MGQHYSDCQIAQSACVPVRYRVARPNRCKGWTFLICEFTDRSSRLEFSRSWLENSDDICINFIYLKKYLYEQVRAWTWLHKACSCKVHSVLEEELRFWTNYFFPTEVYLKIFIEIGMGVHLQDLTAQCSCLSAVSDMEAFQLHARPPAWPQAPVAMNHISHFISGKEALRQHSSAAEQAAFWADVSAWIPSTGRPQNNSHLCPKEPVANNIYPFGSDGKKNKALKLKM